MMSEFREIPALRGNHAALYCALALGLLGGFPFGCERGDSSKPTEEAVPAEPAAETAPPLTTLTFTPDLRAQHPEISAFVDEVLGAWLAGDYEGYRRFVSRAHTPETRERFDAIREVTEAITVESIEPIDSPLVPGPAYRVLLGAELSAAHQARRHEKRRQLAIVVFQELGQWRMATAPAEYQPREEPPPATSSAPTASAPSYPWDEEGDY